MYMVEDRSVAIILMVVSLWCLGSWPIFFNLLERRGRLPQHTYLDYAFSTFIMAVLFAFTFGDVGFSPQNFTIQILQIQENGISALIAMLGGLSLCIGNIVMQYSLAFLGVSLTEVVSSSIAVVIGTTMNYFLDHGLNRASLLFPGVGCFLIAVFLGSFCHAFNASDINIKLGMACHERTNEEGSNVPKDAAAAVSARLLNKTSDCGICGEERENRFCFQDVAPDFQVESCHNSAGSAEFYHHLEQKRSIKIRGSSVAFGFSIALLTGCCYSFFSPLVNIATNDQFHFLQHGVPTLSVYTTFFYFGTAFCICAVAVNVYLLYHPVLGIPKSSISAYIMDHDGRILAILAGVICGLGNGFQFMGGQAAGYAAADAVQALPLVGTFWAIFLFGEYHNSSGTTYILLAGMLVMFVTAVGLLIASSRHR